MKAKHGIQNVAPPPLLALLTIRLCVTDGHHHRRRCYELDRLLKSIGEGRDGRETIVRLLREGAQEHTIDALGEYRINRPWWHWQAAGVLMHQFLGSAVKRGIAREYLIEERGQGVLIGCWPGSASPLFGSHVGVGARGRSTLIQRFRRRHNEIGEQQIGKSEGSFSACKHIRRFHPLVNNAMFVRVLQGIGYLAQNAYHVLQGKRVNIVALLKPGGE